MTKGEIDKCDLRMDHFNRSFSVMGSAKKKKKGLIKDIVSWRKTTCKSHFNKHT